MRDRMIKIRQVIDGWNDSKHPLSWTKTADDILDKITVKGFQHRTTGTMSVINLLYPVMAALVIIMPLKPRTIAGVLLVALFGIGGSVSIAVTDARKPEDQTRQLPLLAVFRTAAGIECSGRGALALLAGAVMGHLYAACFAFVMPALGGQRMGSAARAGTAAGPPHRIRNGRRAREGVVRHPHGLAALLRQHPTSDPGSETRRS
ncbi:MAG TPA: hypothetical protein VF086_16060 [Propionibacteriaceae bacterium]